MNARVYWQRQLGDIKEGWYWQPQDEECRDIKTEKPRGPFCSAVYAGRDARKQIIAARKNVIALIPKRKQRSRVPQKDTNVKTPHHVSIDQINSLIDKNMLPPQVIDEHPLAADLYRRFKAGSQTMTTHEAFTIGNTLDALQHRIRELEAELEALRK